MTLGNEDKNFAKLIRRHPREKRKKNFWVLEEKRRGLRERQPKRRNHVLCLLSPEFRRISFNLNRVAENFTS